MALGNFAGNYFYDLEYENKEALFLFGGGGGFDSGQVFAPKRGK